MSRRLSAALSGVSSFAVAALVGSAMRDRRAGLRAGLVAASVAAVVSWVVYGLVERVEGRTTTETPGVPAAGSD